MPSGSYIGVERSKRCTPASLREYEGGSITFRTLELETRIFSVVPLPSSGIYCSGRLVLAPTKDGSSDEYLGVD
jgi:hypothetical protein